MKPTLHEVLAMTLAERIRLVQDIWDSIAADSELEPMSEPERDEIDRRLADLAENPDAGSPWPDVKARILSRA